MNFKNFKLDISNKKRDLIPQILTVLFIVLIIIYFTINAQINMGNRGISFGFGFLSQESSFDITFSLIDYDGSHSYARAFLVGLLNTILVSAIGILFATLLGVSIGISRLSQNYLIAKTAEWYVEIFRNIPLILQIFFWYFAALRALPLSVDSINFYDISFLNVKGWYVPKFVWTNFSIFLYAIVFALISIILLLRYAKRQRDEFGKQLPTLYLSILILIGFPFLTFIFAGVKLSFEIPELTQLSKTVYVYRGGVSIIPELIALALALSMYTATFIAENVRAGILGVN